MSFDPTRDESETREYPRLRLALPYKSINGSGELHDISVLGVCFHSDVELQVGHEAELDLSIPDRCPSAFEGAVDKVIRVSVIVKWCEPEGHEPGFRVGGKIRKRHDDRHGELMAFLFNEAAFVAKSSQEQLVKESAYSKLAQTMGDPVCLIQNGRIHIANKALADCLGVDRLSLEGKVFSELVVSDQLDRWHRYLHESQRRETPDSIIHLTLRNSTEEPIDFEMRTRALTHEEEPSLVVVLRDLTARKELESRIIQAEKMRALGELASGIAHDFNNILTGILCCSQLLKRKSKKSQDTSKEVDAIEKAAERAAHLVKQLLGYVRMGKIQEVPVDLHVIIEQVSEFLSITIDRDIQIRRQLHANRSVVRGDPDQLYQVILNLAMNARDALEDGGELRIETENVELGEEALQFNSCAQAGSYCKVAVIDNGQGMSMDVEARIFEPFFTTKGPSKGSGMGLPMVHGIVTNHNGTIQVETEKEKGTTVTFFLPNISGTVQPRIERTAVRPNMQEVYSGHILVVDDDATVREATASMLQSLGYEITTAEDGREALAYFRSVGGDVDLVILDMVMPNMNGANCFRHLKEIAPNVKAILTTGRNRNDAELEDLGEDMCGFVQKPYNLSQLLAVISDALS